ncbi:MAG: TRAP transporter permease [Acetobacterales bacterium]
MAAQQDEGLALSRDEIDRMVREHDIGGRRPGPAVSSFLWWTALAWAVFQIYINSPWMFWIGQHVWTGLLMGQAQSRLVHYAFAVLLVFCTYPALARSPRDRVPLSDWMFGLLAASGSLYFFVFYESVSARAAAPTTADIVFSIIGMIGLIEATRRAVGLPLMIVGMIFLSYAFVGPYLPEVLAHTTKSLGRVSDHMWISTEGVFGITLGVSSSLVFLFVTFGSLLERAGAGNWFIKLSFSVLGHLRGGPAKAAVVSSALMGVVSGSALANVVTTGTFTIPLMKKVGFPAEKAAAIESSSSINGQLMPPVMGAAAFVMTEFVGISYLEVIKHALLPAVISYIGLYYIVHLESVKMELQKLEKPEESTVFQSILGYSLTVLGLFLFGAGTYFGISLIRDLFPGYSLFFTMLLFGIVYLVWMWVAAQVPELTYDDPNAPISELPRTRPTALAWLYHLLPVVVLVWFLVVERYSPDSAIFYSIMAQFFIMLTHRPLVQAIRGDGFDLGQVGGGFKDIIDGLVNGARNMVAIAIALAAAGIVVGIVSLTGLGIVMVNVIETISMGNFALMLFWTAVITVILGMGLPTTANYVIVASMMAPVMVTLAGQHGVAIPLIAVHMFVFYCGLMSGNTPPVAVDAYAAAGLAGSNPLRTCLHAFYYSMRTMILPFIFIFNTELLLIGIYSIWHLALVIVASTLAMLAFCAATQHYMLVRNRVWETLVLLLAAFVLLRPGYWMDMLYPPYAQVDPARIYEVAGDLPSGGVIRMEAVGENFAGQREERVVTLQVGERGAPGEERLMESAGVELRIEDGRTVVENVQFNSPAQKGGLDFDYEILSLEVPTDQPVKDWIYIPGLLLLLLVYMSQSVRRRREEREGAAVTA